MNEKAKAGVGAGFSRICPRVAGALETEESFPTAAFSLEQGCSSLVLDDGGMAHEGGPLRQSNEAKTPQPERGTTPKRMPR
jgi:hypothetical protein